MATGPEHYRQAEAHLADLHDRLESGRVASDVVIAITARAQVHATLALAAATAGENGTVHFNDPQWAEVLKP